MRVIPWEDGFDSEQQSLLVGSLLGDARLECRSASGSARLRIHHAERHKEYLFWKYNLLKPWVSRPPWKTVWTDKRNGRKYTSWFFHTRTLPFLSSWWHLFYPRRRKRIPANISSLLNPLALAVWCMDDACFREECLILNTQSFSRAENELLQRYFRKTHGISCAIQRDRRNVRLYFGKSAKEEMLRIIRPFLLSAFQSTVPVTTDPGSTVTVERVR